MNAGATFQREMDISFKGLIGQSVVVYLDDVTVYSKERGDHPKHLKQIFERCRKYRISLNPKKIVFVVSKGILLGHVVSKEGIFSGSRENQIHFTNFSTAQQEVYAIFFWQNQFRQKIHSRLC
jgi:hypothetical protein